MNFRSWIAQMWYEHCAEVEAWERKTPCYGAEEYFRKYKWWLRREFRLVAKKQQS